MDIEVDVNRDYLFVIESKAKNMVLQGKKYPASVTIASEDVIVDYTVGEDGETKPVIRKIRYAPGEKSIFADEQSDNAKGEGIMFVNGILRVHGRNINKIKYLLSANYNRDLPKEHRQHDRVQYKLFNPNVDSRLSVEKQKKNINLKHRILNMPFADLKHLALATSKSEQNIAQIYRAGEDEIRHYLMNQADTNADLFDLNLDDPVLINRVIITRGINEGVLSYNSKTRRIAYASNNTTIIQSTLGTNAIKELASLAEENEEYGAVLKELKKTLKISKVFSSEFEDKVEQIKNDSEEGDTFERAIRKGIKVGVVKQKGNYYEYADKKHNGFSTFAKFLKENPTTFVNLVLEIDEEK